MRGGRRLAGRKLRIQHIPDVGERSLRTNTEFGVDDTWLTGGAIDKDVLAIELDISGTSGRVHLIEVNAELRRNAR